MPPGEPWQSAESGLGRAAAGALRGAVAGVGCCAALVALRELSIAWLSEIGG